MESNKQKKAVANKEMLQKIFTLPEDATSKLYEIEAAISKKFTWVLKRKNCCLRRSDQEYRR